MAWVANHGNVVAIPGFKGKENAVVNADVPTTEAMSSR